MNAKNFKLRLLEEYLIENLSINSFSTARLALPLYALFGDVFYKALDVVENGIVRKCVLLDNQSHVLFTVSCDKVDSSYIVLPGDYICSCNEGDVDFDQLECDDVCEHSVAVVLCEKLKVVSSSFYNKEEFASNLSHFKLKTLLLSGF